MSDILDPQGLEPNEVLQDTDVQGVYQPTSGGIRRNKQATLATLKAFFFKLTSYTPNSIVEADGTGNFRTTGIATSAVAAAIANTAANSIELTDKINQGVKTTDSPSFADATIGGHAVGAELSTLNNRVNQDVRNTATPTFAKVNTGQGATEIYLMNQNVQTTDTPEFADVNITGLDGTVEDRIETNTADIGTNAGDITTLDGRVDGNDTDIGNLQTKTPQSYKTTDDVVFNSVDTGQGANQLYDMDQNVTKNDLPEFFDLNLDGLGATVTQIINFHSADITALETKTPQSYKTTDDVEFNSTKNGNFYEQKNLYTGTTSGSGQIVIAHNIDKDKITGVTAQYKDVSGNWNSGVSSSIVPTWTIDATNVSYAFGNATAGSRPYRIVICNEL